MSGWKATPISGVPMVIIVVGVTIVTAPGRGEMRGINIVGGSETVKGSGLRGKFSPGGPVSMV